MYYDAEVRRLSAAFYRAYPSADYPELLQKGERPYTCLLIDTHDGYLICVPFRSEMKHRQGYAFSGTKRSARSRSGLDYKKLVLIEDPAYLDRAPAVVDPDEYHAVIADLDRIAEEVVAYVDGYRHHVDGSHALHPREFARRYGYATLPYFHDILGLTSAEG